MKGYWAIAVLLAFFSAATNADDNAHGVSMIGTGTLSCAKFTKYDTAGNNSDQMNLIVQWAWGFISAYNLRAAFSDKFQESEAPSPVAPQNEASTLLFIRSYCQNNPKGNVAGATLALIGTSGGIVTSSVILPQN